MQKDFSVANFRLLLSVIISSCLSDCSNCGLEFEISEISSMQSIAYA